MTKLSKLRQKRKKKKHFPDVRLAIKNIHLYINLSAAEKYKFL